MIESLDQYFPQHSFLVQGREDQFDRLIAHYTKKGVVEAVLSVVRFTVEHARIVVEFNAEDSGKERWYIMFFPIFSPDAAQILLKTLEEPTRGTHIVFVTPYPYLVPLTIRSRVLTLNQSLAQPSTKQITKKEAEHFVKEILGDDTLDPSVKRAHAGTFLDALEMVVKNNPIKSTAVYRAKKMLFSANLPTKQIIEYVADAVL